MRREVKKRNEDASTPKKKWRFYDDLVFIVEEDETSKKLSFSVEEKEVIINFYHEHPELWNHRLKEY